MNSTPNSSRGEITLPEPATASTISATPIAAMTRESTNVPARCALRPVISS
jgi:hypothetical protein